ncbi:MAG: hypothetical protein D6776_10300, partial [Planctomycetota bacterium]
ASEPATPRAHDALARTAARAQQPPQPPTDATPSGGPSPAEPVAVEPLASSRLPRAAAAEPGGPATVRAEPELQRVEVRPEPEARGRAEYSERRVRLPKITF